MLKKHTQNLPSHFIKSKFIDKCEICEEFVNLEKTFLRARAINVKQNAAFKVFF